MCHDTEGCLFVSYDCVSAKTVYFSRFVFAMSAFVPIEISYSDM